MPNTTPLVRSVDVSLLLLRLMAAAIGVFHGGQKLFGLFGGSGLKATAEWMASINIPAPMLSALAAGTTEFFGGIFLALGVLTRVWGAGFTFAMLVAIVTVHPNAFAVSNNGMEFALTVGVITLALTIAGPGRLNAVALAARFAGKPAFRPHFALA
ncbi:MAG: DoxX family protein [Phycisphaerales bacterium]